jgi:hypothetical protein
MGQFSMEISFNAGSLLSGNQHRSSPQGPSRQLALDLSAGDACAAVKSMSIGLKGAVVAGDELHRFRVQFRLGLGAQMHDAYLVAPPSGENQTLESNRGVR